MPTVKQIITKIIQNSHDTSLLMKSFGMSVLVAFLQHLEWSETEPVNSST